MRASLMTRGACHCRARGAPFLDATPRVLARGACHCRARGAPPLKIDTAAAWRAQHVTVEHAVRASLMTHLEPTLVLLFQVFALSGDRARIRLTDTHTELAIH